MRKKREHHDKVVEKFKSKEFLEENVSLFHKNIYSIQNMFREDKEKNEDDIEDEEEDYGDSETREGNASIKTFDDEELVIKITNNDDEKTKNKKNCKAMSKKVEKRKQQQSAIDTEHFIPYKPKNFNQEKA